MAQPGRGASGCGPQTLAPAPLIRPHSCPSGVGGWWGDLVPGGRGWDGGLDGPLCRHPPRHPGLAPSTGCPAARTSAQAQTSIHTRALAPSFFSALLFPPQLASFFFFPLLSLFQHVITVETKSVGTMRALTKAPLQPPPPTVRASTLSTRPGLEPLPKEPC